MNKLISLISLFLALNFSVFSQHADLNGQSIRYKYSNGSEVQANFKEDLYHFHWLTGPYKGIQGAVPYQSFKISKNKYVINFVVESHASYVTLFFDFKKNKMIGSAIIRQKGEVIQSIDKAEIINKRLVK